MFHFLTLAVLPLACSIPTLVYPLDQQQPPVARVGKSFLFSALPGSFNSTANITYTSSSLPSWLAFSPGATTFAGTPAASDVGEFPVTLTATDASGSTSSKFNLIVTNYSSPAVHRSFTTQIADPSSRAFASAVALPGGTGVSIPPFWSFSLGWAADTFRTSRTDPINGELYFAARQRGTAGLPSWLQFNNETMTFTGVAPASGTYTIVGTGTDFWGYTGAQTSFVIEVGQGQAVEMAKGQNLTDLVTMARGTVAYTVDLSGVLIGGTKADASQLALSVDKTAFPWLSVSGNKLVGTTPDAYLNGTYNAMAIPVTISSTNTSNTLSATTYIGLDVMPYIFTAFSLPAASANPGQSYNFDLSQYLNNKTATVNATVSPAEAAQWLVFDATKKSLSGTAPKSANYAAVSVAFSAALNGMTATSDLKVAMAGSTAVGNSTGSAAVPEVQSGSHGLSQAAKIALGVVFGVLGLILLALLLFCCCRRRRRSNPKDDDDADSFVAGPRSPMAPQDPFRKSNTLEPPRNILGDIARFSGFKLGHSPDPSEKPRSTSIDTEATMAVTVSEKDKDQPMRVDGLNGIFGWQPQQVDDKPALLTPRLPTSNSSRSFLGQGDVIAVGDVVNRPSQDASSFTESESSRASWESKDSFQWSSGHEDEPYNPRISAAPSIPRPRDNFTPRYPRNATKIASNRTLDGSPDFSEFSHEGEGEDSFDTLGSPGSSFPSGPSGLHRFGESSNFRSISEDEDEGTDADVEPAVVALAERQSFETRRPQTTPKLRPSRERQSTVEDTPPSHRSRQALDGAFDDAEEARRSREVTGLGYPASAIFGSEYDARSSMQPSEGRNSTIKAVPQLENPISPPLPTVASFTRHRPQSFARPTSVVGDGRVVACANETFSLHPAINPPPNVSLSAATWQSAQKSTYRAELENGKTLPGWLHFDARELELWGVPAITMSGEVSIVKIIERLPRDKRNSGDPVSYGYVPQQEREVGRVTIEVVDRLKSPQFALDASPHAY